MGESIKLIANNKKAYHDYFIEDNYEAGISLHGTEVKSLRMGKCSIKESFIRIENGEVIIYGMHVSPYEKGNIFNKDPLRPRKLLLHRAEINKLLVPIYLKGKLVYKRPGIEEIKKYCAEQVDTLWDEVKRFDNPHNYYVDLSQKLYDIKTRLLNEKN